MPDFTSAGTAVTASTGGNGAADSGKVAEYDGSGNLRAETVYADVNVTTPLLNLKEPISDFNGDIRATNLTDDRAYELPDSGGTIFVTAGGNSLVISPATGVSKTVVIQTTTSGGVATTALTIADNQNATFTKNVILSGGGLDVTLNNGGLVLRGTTPAVSFNGLFKIHSLTDGVMRFFNDAGTKGISFDVTTTDGMLKLRNKTNGADGSFTAGAGTFSAPVIVGGYTVATLPAGTTGMHAYVTDATAPTYLGALTGGGAVVCPVFYNGAAWVSH